MITAEEREKEKMVEDERKGQRRKEGVKSERRGWEVEEIWRGEKRRGGTEEKVGHTSKKSWGLNTGPPQHGGNPTGDGWNQTECRKKSKSQQGRRRWTAHVQHKACSF